MICGCLKLVHFYQILRKYFPQIPSSLFLKYSINILATFISIHLISLVDKYLERLDAEWI